MTPLAQAVLEAYRQDAAGQRQKAEDILRQAKVNTDEWNADHAGDFWDWLYDNTDLDKETCKGCAEAFLEGNSPFAETMGIWFGEFVAASVPTDICEKCGEETSKDCQGGQRCPICDPPCPGCYDGN